MPPIISRDEQPQPCDEHGECIRHITPALIENLRKLADPYGALGVAHTAALLTDPAVLIVHLVSRGHIDADAAIAAVHSGRVAAETPRDEPMSPDADYADGHGINPGRTPRRTPAVRLTPPGTEPESPHDTPLTPDLGMSVHYLAHGSADGRYPTTCRTAVVTQVPTGYNPRLRMLSLMVMNPTGVFFNTEIPHAQHAACGDPSADPARGGTWHWPRNGR